MWRSNCQYERSFLLFNRNVKIERRSMFQINPFFSCWVSIWCYIFHRNINCSNINCLRIFISINRPQFVTFYIESNLHIIFKAEAFASDRSYFLSHRTAFQCKIFIDKYLNRWNSLTTKSTRIERNQHKSNDLIWGDGGIDCLLYGSFHFGLHGMSIAFICLLKKRKPSKKKRV